MARPRLVRLMLGSALLLLGMGTGLLSLGPAGATGPSLLAPNRPINGSAADARVLEANNSPALVRNPMASSNLVVAHRIDAAPFGCAVRVSFDGGITWARTPIPFAESGSRECFAPDAVFDAGGTLYVSYVTLEGRGNVPADAWLTSSTDGGRTLSPPTRLLGNLAFQVRLAADPRAAGRLYVTWLDAASVGLLGFPRPGNPIRVMRSEDGGVSWSRPVTVTGRDRAVGAVPVAGPGGRLYVLFLDLRQDALDYHGEHEGRGGPPFEGAWQLVLARSRDGGETWQESVVDRRVLPAERLIPFIPPFPSLAVDPADGRLYAAFHDGRLGDADVWLWSSSDGGETWGAAVRVNDTPRRDGRSQYRPQVAVASDGRVDVVYYDRRYDADDRMNEVSLQSSFDRGASFAPRLVLTDRPFDSSVGFGFERGLPDLGSRLGLVSSSSRAVAIWADTRGGTPDFPKQDLAAAIVAFPRERAVIRPALGYAAPVVGVAGVFLILTALPSRRTTEPGVEAR